MTPQQIDQVLKLLPQLSRIVSQLDIDNEQDYYFAGDVFCLCAETKTSDWILDIGATDYMTPKFRSLTKVKAAKGQPKTKLTNGNSADITHIGHIIA